MTRLSAATLFGVYLGFTCTVSVVAQSPDQPTVTDPVYGDTYKIKRVPERLQREGDMICGWLQKALKLSAECPPIFSSEVIGDVLKADGAAFVSGTVVNYDIAVTAGLPGGPADRVWIAIAVHEYLHRVRYVFSDWALGTWSSDDLWVEEGVVQAVTEDVLPIVVKKVFKGKTTDEVLLAYTNEVNAIRAWSAAATGRSWRSAQARRARRQLLNADRLTRRVMLAQYGVTVR